MTSSSASEYRRKCSELLKDALLRPSMFVRSLEEFEALLDGHFIAFQQLGFVEGNDSFQNKFGSWLEHSKHVAAPSGWAYAIKRMAKDPSKSNSLFEELATEFLEEWNKSEEV